MNAFEKILKDFENIPREQKNNINEVKEKTTSDSFKNMTEGFESISKDTASEDSKDDGQQEKGTDIVKEKKAIKDMRRLLALLEKRIIGKLDEKDTQEIHDNARQWVESIAVLRKYVETTGIK